MTIWVQMGEQFSPNLFVSRNLRAAHRRIVPFLLLVVLVWLNAYVARELFTVQATAKMNSMQGFWAALATHAGWAWWIPTWWPYWDAGMPFEYTYAPLLPALVAFVARVAHIPEIRAVHWLPGAVYCLGPVSLAFVVCRLGKSPYWAFPAGVIFSLWSPALLVAPNERFAFANRLQADRLSL